MSPRCSVVLTTYERPDHLRLALAGYLRQTERDFELIVADDGSGPETAAVVKDFAERAPFPVHHLWHADEGHRRTVMLNRGIAAAESDYVVFSDGDCIPAANFLAVHLAERRPSRMLIAGYVRIERELAEKADTDWVASGAYEALATPAQIARLRRKHWKNVWQILIRRRRRPHNLGLNMSNWKSDLLRVNGWDEAFRGWGNADGDLRERLKRAGVRPRSIWHRALVFHLEHPVEASRSDRSANAAYARRADIPIFAEQGIVKADAPQSSGAAPRSSR